MNTTPIVDALDVVTITSLAEVEEGVVPPFERLFFVPPSSGSVPSSRGEKSDSVLVVIPCLSEGASTSTGERTFSGERARVSKRASELRLCSSSEYSVTITFTTGKTLIASVASQEFSTSSNCGEERFAKSEREHCQSQRSVGVR
jgi:hypothetical protein